MKKLSDTTAETLIEFYLTRKSKLKNKVKKRNELLNSISEIDSEIEALKDQIMNAEIDLGINLEALALANENKQFVENIKFELCIEKLNDFLKISNDLIIR
jgi:predicted nuclease with TOPRIM domain